MKQSLIFLLAVGFCFSVSAQIPISDGPYSQHFDSLATSGTANPWTDNSTIPGWYASTGLTAAVSYRAGYGDGNAGALWSFGTNGINVLTDRAFGALGSGSFKTISFGVRFANDTGASLTNIAVSYTGEMWRVPNGSNAVTNTLAFSYRIDNSPITDADAANAGPAWTSLSALDFNSPYITTGSGFPVDGNGETNRHIFTNIVLSGVVLLPGEELFLRWRKIDDFGSDGGLAVDDLAVDFGVALQPSAPSIIVGPESQIVTEGDAVVFSVVAGGTPPLSYQWRFNNANLDGETNNTLALDNVTTNQAGSYSVIVTNSLGSTNSDTAALTVNSRSGQIKLVQFNVRGNGASDWTTNAAQVQAIGRQLRYLSPDVVTFNEIPNDYYFEMTNFVKAFLPGYWLAVSSGTDGFIRSAIASRFTIVRSNKWLDAADLKPFGYTNTSSGLADNFTRDLFEAQINVPGYPRLLHVFTTHLKSSSDGYATNALKRAAEAAAITNFFATNLFVLYPDDPYTLSGDMNEDNSNAEAIQRLISLPTGLHLTSPVNPFTGSFNTYSTATANPSSRLDYIFPCTLLYSNIASGEVFRTDKLNPLPPGLNGDDCKVASDHYPVFIVFNNPYNRPIQIQAAQSVGGTFSMNWASVPGQAYRLEASSNLVNWALVATNLVATNYSFTLTTNTAADTRFFRISR